MRSLWAPKDQHKAIRAMAADPTLAAYTAGVRRAALEEAAQALDAQHEARKQHDNHAAFYARMVRELI